MPQKDFTLESGLNITVYKRRSNRHLRLSIGPSGKVRVSIPTWAPYSAGLNFAKSRQAWIQAQYTPPAVLRPGQAVGKGHHLRFVAKVSASKVTSRVYATEITVSHPMADDPSSPGVQKVAREACIRSLRLQAEQLLPQRLATLADKYGFTYSKVSVKRLKSRWGSCDQQGHIVLNLFLMQLPWNMIDYVLLHELTHTKILRHGPDFWQAMQAVSPQSPQHRRQLRDYQPVLTVD